MTQGPWRFSWRMTALATNTPAAPCCMGNHTRRDNWRRGRSLFRRHTRTHRSGPQRARIDPPDIVRDPLRPNEAHLYHSESHSGNFLNVFARGRKPFVMRMSLTEPPARSCSGESQSNLNALSSGTHNSIPSPTMRKPTDSSPLLSVRPGAFSELPMRQYNRPQTGAGDVATLRDVARPLCRLYGSCLASTVPSYFSPISRTKIPK